VTRIGSWRQGDFLVGEPASRLIEANLDRGVELSLVPCGLLLITQDCDLVAPASKEPWVEFLVTESIRHVDGNFTLGRNPRVLDLAVGVPCFRLSIHRKIKVPKNLLESCSRDSQLSWPSTELNVVLRWLARRYLRPAFPDAFNARLSVASDAILRWEKKADDVSFVLFQLNTDAELEPGDSYVLDVILGFPKLPYQKAQSDWEVSFETLLSVPGIFINNVRCLSEDDINVPILRAYKKWEKDFRSLPEGPEKAIAPVGLDTV